jgi:hypothetical protein
VIGRADPPEAQQTIAPIISFLNTRPLKWRAHIPIISQNYMDFQEIYCNIFDASFLICPGRLYGELVSQGPCGRILISGISYFSEKAGDYPKPQPINIV